MLWSVAWAEQGRLCLSGWFINRHLRVTQVQHASAPGSLRGEQLCLLFGGQKLVGMGATVTTGRKRGWWDAGSWKQGLGSPGDLGRQVCVEETRKATEGHQSSEDECIHPGVSSPVCRQVSWHLLLL